MDFMDTSFASVDTAEYAGFLGIGNKGQKAIAQNQYEVDIQNRYPFSEDCQEMKAIVTAMYQESAATLQQRNSAKKNSKNRNDLTGKLRAFDAYIPMAEQFMKTVSCAVQTPAPLPAGSPTTPTGGGAAAAPAGSGDVLGTAVVPTPANGQANVTATASASTSSLLPAGATKSNLFKYGAIGFGLLAAVAITVAIVRHRTAA